MRMIVVCVTLAGAIAVMGGCAAMEKMNADHQTYLLNVDKQKCTGFGFTPGTDPFAHCMMNLSQQKSAQAAEAQRQADYNKMVAEQRDKDRAALKDAAAQQGSDFSTRPPMSPAEKMICEDRKAATNSNDVCE
jgi:hypothetical protein